MHQFHPSILREYDIRGTYGKTLFDKDAYHLGLVFPQVISQASARLKINVGCDGRASSPVLKAQLIKGLTDAGADVIDVGLVPTPALYFSVQHLKSDAGVMITGSHNPKDHNGFKITLRDRPFYGEDIKNLARFVSKIDLQKTAKGSIQNKDIEDGYVNRILADLNLPATKKLSIAWDSGNGATGRIVEKLCNRISAAHVTLFTKIDGDFPNHHPDPTDPKNLEDLKAAVAKNSCDFGIAFDGDGDRIGAIDDTGEVIFGDQLMIFFARDVLAAKPGSTIIADVKASDVLFDEIARAGGIPVMAKTGHSLIKSKMKETGAALAGEMSGHIFFADKYYGYDDALYSAIRLISIIANSPLSLSQMRAQLPKTFSTPEIRVPCLDSEKFAIVEKLKSHLIKNGISFNPIDGVRVKTDHGWWLLRASNTEPVLVVRCESNSSDGLKSLKEEVDKYLKIIKS